MRWQSVVVAISLVALALAIAYAMTLGILNVGMPFRFRHLATLYIETAFSPWNRLLSAMTPAMVSAIVWDYRGIDTFFETAVFYGAIIGSIALLGFVITPRRIVSRGLSLVVKTVTRIVIALILVVGAAIALHGHLTPGGGFQGGSTLAVVTAVALVTFGLSAVVLKGVRCDRMVVLRSVGLVGITLVGVALLIASLLTHVHAYVFQNQPKPGAPIGMPYAVDGAIVSGTVLILNVLEAIAVAAGFTLLLLIFAAPEESPSSGRG